SGGVARGARGGAPAAGGAGGAAGPPPPPPQHHAPASRDGGSIVACPVVIATPPFPVIPRTRLLPRGPGAVSLVAASGPRPPRRPPCVHLEPAARPPRHPRRVRQA